MLVLREEIEDDLVGDADILGVAAQRHPAEGAAPLAEKRANEGRHEAGVGEGLSVSSGPSFSSERRIASKHCQLRAARPP